MCCTAIYFQNMHYERSQAKLYKLKSFRSFWFVPPGLRLFRTGLLCYRRNLPHQTARKSPAQFLPPALREEAEQQGSAAIYPSLPFKKQIIKSGHHLKSVSVTGKMKWQETTSTARLHFPNFSTENVWCLLFCRKVNDIQIVSACCHTDLKHVFVLQFNMISI